MKKNFFAIISAGVLFLSMAFMSCKKEGSLDEETIEAITDQAVFSLEANSNAGKQGCYDFVFPIIFSFPNGTEKSVNSYEELVSNIRNYVRENGRGRAGRSGSYGQGNPNGYSGSWQGAQYRPRLVLPVTVLDENGATITVTTEDELKTLREKCGKGFFAAGNFRGHAGNCTPCFTINFPITVVLPNGTTQQATDRAALQNIARTWRQNNPASSSRPEIQFAISVTKRDGSIVTVNNKDELRALRTSCN